jgi:hypothetical protein
MATKKRASGQGLKPHAFKGVAAVTSVRLYPIDKSFLTFKYGGVSAALEHLCKGDEYAIYLQQQLDKITKK